MYESQSYGSIVSIMFISGAHTECALQASQQRHKNNIQICWCLNGTMSWNHSFIYQVCCASDRKTTSKQYQVLLT